MGVIHIGLIVKSAAGVRLVTSLVFLHVFFIYFGEDGNKSGEERGGEGEGIWMRRIGRRS